MMTRQKAHKKKMANKRARNAAMTLRRPFYGLGRDPSGRVFKTFQGYTDKPAMPVPNLSHQHPNKWMHPKEAYTKPVAVLRKYRRA